ncbi:MAG: glycosyltransferase [Candidatus Tectomicrobia bacterium]|nr:glycosyltransferase [Candidatus Tectomicrobia bacterium]
MAILYISYDGLLEPLGQSQVLQYVTRLAARYPLTLLTFEKRADWRQTTKRRAIEEQVRKAGVRWIPLRYHKRISPIATSYDLLRGLLVCGAIVLLYRIRVVHARSYVAALLALAMKKLFGARFLFDMRGFWADERVEGGLWPKGGRLYRLAKWWERRFLTHADAVVSLTHAGVEAMRRFPCLEVRAPRFAVIPTCTNRGLFKPQTCAEPRRPPGAAGEPFTLGHVGAVGLWYQFEATAACFALLLSMQPRARFLILNRDAHEFIRDRLAAHAAPSSQVEVKAVDYPDVPREMGRMHAGVFFIKPVFSKLASAPTVLGEFLSCGIPCLSNAGVGDVEEILEGERVGVAIREFTPEAMRHGLARLLALTEEPDISQRCVGAAAKHFDLEAGVAAYARLYADLHAGAA